MEKKTINKFHMLLIIGIYFITMATAYGSSYLYNLTINHRISHTIMTGIGVGLLVFTMIKEYLCDNWSYDNGEHILRFFVVFLICLVAACMLPLLPNTGWFYPIIAVALALFSNTLIGIIGSSLLLMLSVLLGQVPASIFMMYFICNLVAILVFSNINEEFQVGLPIFITIVLLLVATMAMDTLFLPSKLTLEVFVLPIINVFITAILLLILLKVFSTLIVHRHRSKYMAINDQEYELLVNLKKESKQFYYQAIHCAYLCERIATKINLNSTLTKAGGYYHKIGILKGNNTWDNIREICMENQFPTELTQLLMEYSDRKTMLVSKEATVLVFADAVITSIMYLFEKDHEAKIDYEQVIEMIFKKKLENNNIKYSMLTLTELYEMKRILLEEKLYYDFLR